MISVQHVPSWVRGGLVAGAGLWLAVHVSAQTDVGNFRVPDTDEEGVLKTLLTGEKAKMYPDKPMWIEGLVIEFFEEDGETVHLRLTSPGCHYDTRSNFAESDQPVLIVGDTFTVEGVGYKFDSNTSRMELLNEVRVVFSDTNLTPAQEPADSPPALSEPSEPSESSPSPESP
jgi:lipopolysaccharide export system protein LptC